MSDGPSKMAPPGGQPDAPALDDIILGDDDHTVPTAPVQPRATSVAPPRRPAVTPDGGNASKDASASDEGRSRSTPERSSTRPKAADASKDASATRKRAKMTLRIPDDEVSRPQLPATTPMGGIPAIGASRPPSSPALSDDDDTLAGAPAPLHPQRIISLGSAEDTLELPAVDLEGRAATAGSDRSAGRAPGVDAAQEAGWTPYQPMVADRVGRPDAAPAAPAQPDFGGERVSSRDREAAAAAAQTAMREPARTMIDDPALNAFAQHRDDRTSDAPASEDIPIDTDDDDASSNDRFDEQLTHPRLPVAPDSEEIKVEEGERHTDPGEVPDEVAPEDLVSVESIPHSPHAPPLFKTAGKHGTLTASPPITATSLMSGAAPGRDAGVRASAEPLGGAAPMSPLPLAASAGGGPLYGGASSAVTPIAPAVAAKSPSARPPAGGAAQAGGGAQGGGAQAGGASAGGASDYVPSAGRSGLPKSGQGRPLSLDLGAGSSTDPGDPGPIAGTPMARRQQPAGGPFGFMPQVGALAPPPMNEAAANRKKTRPWWEDLFNDDFIRTMAKITDGDIAREANFIEESLGCEAGATILDLACGTGRHAVELASRGYQVVGFDLSLAMLARASDEAQDRNQKINFVQGDMREMTFEETFDGVFSWNTSFGFFDEEKNAAVIAKVHRALKKGGQFLLDVVNRDSLIRSAPSLAWFEGDGCICMDEMQIDFITSRMKVKRTLMMDDGRTKEIEYSIRVYSLHELGKMLHDNGFRVAEVSGRTGTPGVFFGCESPRTLILAEKR